MEKVKENLCQAENYMQLLTATTNPLLGYDSEMEDYNTMEGNVISAQSSGIPGL